jgi:hypothetical protein
MDILNPTLPSDAKRGLISRQQPWAHHSTVTLRLCTDSSFTAAPEPGSHQILPFPCEVDLLSNEETGWSAKRLQARPGITAFHLLMFRINEDLTTGACRRARTSIDE